MKTGAELNYIRPPTRLKAGKIQNNDIEIIATNITSEPFYRLFRVKDRGQNTALASCQIVKRPRLLLHHHYHHCYYHFSQKKRKKARITYTRKPCLLVPYSPFPVLGLSPRVFLRGKINPCNFMLCLFFVDHILHRSYQHRQHFPWGPWMKFNHNLQHALHRSLFKGVSTGKSTSVSVGTYWLGTEKKWRKEKRK